MYTPTQLEIIKVFGRKELSFGCLVKMKRAGKIRIYKYLSDFDIVYPDVRYYHGIAKFIGKSGKIYNRTHKNGPECEILGHESHLEDVFRVAKESGIIIYCLRFQNSTQSCTIQLEDKKQVFDIIDYNPTIPFLSQPEETLQQILNLFK